MGKRFVLIDGHSIMNRAFYGVPDLTNAEGFHTNAVYGFLNIMFRVLEDENAEYLAVAFDVKAPTFRHKIYKEYKGTRKPMPEELREQIPVIKELLGAMQIPVLQKEGFEADDILGTLAGRLEREGFEVTVVSGDRDLLQLATEQVKIRMPRTVKGKTEVEDYFAGDVLAKYQVTPPQIIDLKALMGDASDNIPGVPKIGEKTATSLVVEYGTIENLETHIEEIAKKSIRETLTENFELARLSKVLATINVEADIDFVTEDARIQNLYTEQAYAFMKRLGFKNLLSRFEVEAVPEKSQTGFFRMVTELSEAEDIFKKAEEADCLGIQLIGEERLLGAAVAFGEEEIYYISVQGLMTADYLSGRTETLLQKTKAVKGMFYLKGQLKWFADDFHADIHDIQLMAYLLNPLKNDYDQEDIANEHLSLSVRGPKELFGKKTLEEAQEQMPGEFLEYAGYAAYINYRATGLLLQKVEECGMGELLRTIEEPLVYCLYHMEREGIGIEPQQLEAYGEQLIGRISELEQSIHEESGEDFNVNSPKQLGEILFEKMKIPGGKKTKTGYSTAADILEKLAPEYPFVAAILEYRGLAKLKSTYADGMKPYITEDRRIHSTFNQTITATGRISSTEPNLQNIPIRMELGRQIRKVFVPREGFVFVDADYSQIELRILAHMSGDARLIEAYNRDQDIHRITASEVFHTPFDEVTPLQRRNAKAVNFGIVYGISSFGLSQDLSITRKEAKEYIDKYFETYPGVKLFLDRLVADAKRDGYVTTMFGRRRPVPELSSSNFMQRSFGERVAMNAPIQGTAADIMKLAMIHIEEALKQNNLRSRLILQVHDEVLIEAPVEEEKRVIELVKASMMEAAKLSVRLEIDIHSGKNWYEAK